LRVDTPFQRVEIDLGRQVKEVWIEPARAKNAARIIGECLPERLVPVELLYEICIRRHHRFPLR